MHIHSYGFVSSLESDAKKFHFESYWICQFRPWSSATYNLFQHIITKMWARSLKIIKIKNLDNLKIKLYDQGTIFDIRLRYDLLVFYVNFLFMPTRVNYCFFSHRTRDSICLQSDGFTCKTNSYAPMTIVTNYVRGTTYIFPLLTSFAELTTHYKIWFSCTTCSSWNWTCGLYFGLWWSLIYVKLLHNKLVAMGL